MMKKCNIPLEEEENGILAQEKLTWHAAFRLWYAHFVSFSNKLLHIPLNSSTFAASFVKRPGPPAHGRRLINFFINPCHSHKSGAPYTPTKKRLTNCFRWEV
jgi:hypothetical protein